MKKNFKFLLLLFGLSLFIGCTKEYVTREYITEEIYEGTGLSVEYVTIKNSDWNHSNGDEGKEGSYLYCDIDCEKITSDVLEKGAVLVYYIDGNSRDNILPCMIPYESQNGNLTENIRFECETGLVTIKIECSDFSTTQRIGDMEFKICVLVP